MSRRNALKVELAVALERRDRAPRPGTRGRRGAGRSSSMRRPAELLVAAVRDALERRARAPRGARRDDRLGERHADRLVGGPAEHPSAAGFQAVTQPSPSIETNASAAVSSTAWLSAAWSLRGAQRERVGDAGARAAGEVARSGRARRGENGASAEAAEREHADDWRPCDERQVHLVADDDRRSPSTGARQLRTRVVPAMIVLRSASARPARPTFGPHRRAVAAGSRPRAPTRRRAPRSPAVGVDGAELGAGERASSSTTVWATSSSSVAVEIARPNAYRRSTRSFSKASSSTARSISACCASSSEFWLSSSSRVCSSESAIALNERRQVADLAAAGARRRGRTGRRRRGGGPPRRRGGRPQHEAQVVAQKEDEDDHARPGRGRRRGPRGRELLVRLAAGATATRRAPGDQRRRTGGAGVERRLPSRSAAFAARRVIPGAPARQRTAVLGQVVGRCRCGSAATTPLPSGSSPTSRRAGPASPRQLARGRCATARGSARPRAVMR